MRQLALTIPNHLTLSCLLWLPIAVVLVTGDRAVAEEARALLGEIVTVAVKEAVSRTAACCLNPEVSRKMIRKAAQQAIQLDAVPSVISPPITVRLAFLRAAHADMAELIPGSQRIDGRTVEWTGKDMPDAYKTLRAMLSLASTI